MVVRYSTSISTQPILIIHQVILEYFIKGLGGVIVVPEAFDDFGPAVRAADFLESPELESWQAH
jgi:hypothetical protein